MTKRRITQPIGFGAIHHAKNLPSPTSEVLGKIYGKETRGRKPSFYGFIRYNLKGEFIDIVKNSERSISEINGSWARITIYNASRPLTSNAKTAYGFIWRRIQNKDDAFEKNIDLV